MKKLVSLLASAMIVVSAFFITSGAVTTSADAVSAATSKPTYTIQDVRNLQDYLLAKPIDNITQEELKAILGGGDVTVTLSN